MEGSNHVESSATESLSVMLREGTAEAHRYAEGAPLVKGLFGGELRREAFAQLLARLYGVYEAMEEAMEERRDDAVLAPLYFPELRRCAPLRDDLQFHFGDAWAEQGKSAASAAYADRIREVGEGDAVLLVAHHYTRYLGDLSGGQTLAAAARRRFGLTDGRGLSFFEFPEIERPNEFKQQYRARLDSLPLDAEARRRVVDEAVRAFHFNRAVADELWNEYAA